MQLPPVWVLRWVPLTQCPFHFALIKFHSPSEDVPTITYTMELVHGLNVMTIILIFLIIKPSHVYHCGRKFESNMPTYISLWIMLQQNCTYLWPFSLLIIVGCWGQGTHTRTLIWFQSDMCLKRFRLCAGCSMTVSLWVMSHFLPCDSEITHSGSRRRRQEGRHWQSTNRPPAFLHSVILFLHSSTHLFNY